MIVETLIVCVSLIIIFMTTSSILEHVIDLRSNELEEYKKTAEKALEEKPQDEIKLKLLIIEMWVVAGVFFEFIDHMVITLAV